MLEDIVADEGGVQHWKSGEESRQNGPKEELVATDVVYPLHEVLLAVGLHAEEGTAHINHLRSEEEREPSKADESGDTRAKNTLKSLRVRLVACGAEGAVPEAEHDEGEGAEIESGH